MKRIIALIIVSASLAVAQQPPAPQLVTPKAPYDSDKAQLAYEKQKNAQLTANAATQAYQAQMKDLQGQWQTEEQVILAWVAEVKKANGWDDTYTYDREKDSWTHTPKPDKETKPAETPKK